MFEATITHRVEAPGLVEALNNLAGALKCVAPPTCIAADPGAPKAANVALVPAAAATALVPITAATAPAAANPGPAQGTAAAAVPPVAVTFDNIVAAGSQLLDAGRMNDLLGLLQSFGVQAITQLKPEQYADVAEALRGLGAQI